MSAPAGEVPGGFVGPRCWLVSIAVGLAVGLLLGATWPLTIDANGRTDIPLILVAPFGLLLAGIALLPLLAPRFWHSHYADVAFGLGAIVAGYYLKGVSGGSLHLLHAATEYYSFIGLVGGLYVASAGIVINTREPAGPASNTIFLLVGAVLTNLVGTTGASVLLIRPFLRANHARIRPLHVVFFILIVSNCGGMLTPIGDPPLYLGYLRGMPFFWPSESLARSWLLANGLLLAIYFVYDRWVEKRFRAGVLGRDLEPPSVDPGVRLHVRPATVLLLALVVAGVFIDPLLDRYLGIRGIPIGPTLQICVSLLAYKTASFQALERNQFTWGPVKEVAFLFVGIFVTMTPALAYLAQHGRSLGATTPTAFYFASGLLSSVLDNAPTYLNFLQIAVTPAEITRESVGVLLGDATGQRTLQAISTGAVMFGALTYIGNGPNFMVRSIAEGANVRMPSFFGYAMWAALILGPVLVLHWVIILR